jgi:hypothetical protein
MNANDIRDAQLELFRTTPSHAAPRDAQDLMAYPFFALGKNNKSINQRLLFGGISISYQRRGQFPFFRCDGGW